MTQRPPRSAAEWASLIASASIVLVVVGLIVARAPGQDRPADPVARVEGVRDLDGGFHVDVTVRNGGERTAAQVQVSAALESQGSSPATAEQTIDFLAGGEEKQLVFVFEEDPESGELDVTVTGYAVP